MFKYDLRRDGAATLVILAIVAVALSILNYRLSRAQLSNKVVKAKYELQALEQAMASYSIEFPQTPLNEIILKTKKESHEFFHQGYLIQSASQQSTVQLLPRNSLDGFVYPLPKPELPLKQLGSNYALERFYALISIEGKRWRLSLSLGPPPKCTSLGDHNMAESSFHLRFPWSERLLNEQNKEISTWSAGPYVDYTRSVDLVVGYDPSNGLSSHGFLIQ